MGTMIHLTCSTCAIDRTECVGMGMMGHGSELCGCNHCRRYILKRTSWDSGSDASELTCPYCRRPIKPIEDGDPCPVCSSPISVEFVGLWD